MVVLNLSILVFIFGFVNAAGVGDDYVLRYKDYKVYEIKGSESELLDLKRLLVKIRDELSAVGESDAPSIVVEGSRSKWAVLVSPRASNLFQQTLKDRKLTATLIYDDYSQIIAREKLARTTSRTSKFSWTEYYDVDDIYEYLRNVHTTYPESSEVIVGGKSYEGRDILGLRINTGNKTDKPVFFIESGIHAREWIVPATTTYFINQLFTNANITALRDSFDWRIFPTINPDGYHYSHTKDRMWRKTRSKSSNGCIGADANRNWDHNWNTADSSNNPCDYQIYAGSKPFSEIETRSLSEYISGIENLLFYVGFHSAAQILLLPYSDSTKHVDNYDDLVKIGKTSLEYGEKVNGNIKYGGPDPAAAILYAASGGSMDWVREKLGTRLVYTYELRGGTFEWPKEKIVELGDEVTQMILGLAHEAAELGYH